MVQSQPRQMVCETLSQKNPSHTPKKRLVAWLKVQTLSSNPSTTTKQNKTKQKNLPIK
jgi:hypothetical protein